MTLLGKSTVPISARGWIDCERHVPGWILKRSLFYPILLPSKGDEREKSRVMSHDEMIAWIQPCHFTTALGTLYTGSFFRSSEPKGASTSMMVDYGAHVIHISHWQCYCGTGNVTLLGKHLPWTQRFLIIPRSGLMYVLPYFQNRLTSMIESFIFF